MKVEKTILIATVFTGFNYGSSLQSYATETIIKNIGYCPQIVKLSGSVQKGRDIRLRKAAAIAFRMLLHPTLIKRTLSTYRQNMSSSLNKHVKKMFNIFTEAQLHPLNLKWGQLKKLAKKESVVACICGSDQIWNADTLYVDPLYYLRFAPHCKRVAFAPSFGRTTIPKYNIKKISKWVSDIPYLSVRENSGSDLVNQMTNRVAQVVLDPTLLIERRTWIEFSKKVIVKEDYLLVYFLNEPNDTLKSEIRKFADNHKWKICCFSQFAYWHGVADVIVDAGPKEFVSLISNARFVFTDSFHGTAFSINLNVPFYVFERAYGLAGKQSTRITSLLSAMGLNERFIVSLCNRKIIDFPIDFEYSNAVLSKEREKASNYLKKSISGCKD